MEEQTKKLIADVRHAAELEYGGSRELRSRISYGKITATPLETTDGPVVLIERVASLAHVRIAEGDLGRQNARPDLRPQGEH